MKEASIAARALAPLPGTHGQAGRDSEAKPQPGSPGLLSSTRSSGPVVRELCDSQSRARCADHRRPQEHRQCGHACCTQA